MYGLPDDYVEEIRSMPPEEVQLKRRLLILDDLITKIGKKPELVTNLFIVGRLV